MINYRIGKYGCLISTNQFLRDMVNAEFQSEGLVIQTEKQTAGRGYGTNGWESEEGKNLLFSLYLKPDFLAAANQFYLSKVMSLTLINVLEQISDKEGFSIKWPNDIYFNDLKIAGILMENSVQGNILSDSIMGVGLNINQKIFSDSLPNPISLAHITNKEWDKDEILMSILKIFNSEYENLMNTKFKHIKENYLKHLFRLNVKSKYFIDNQIVEGTIVGIDEFGRLELLINNVVKIFGFKEVEFVI